MDEHSNGIHTIIPSMFPALIRLWIEVFPEDTPDDARQFLNCAVRFGNGLVWMERGEPMSMVFSLPAQLLTGVTAQQLPVRYIYAAGTAVAARSRGLFPALLRRAHQLAAEQGTAAMFLHPAQQWLYSYYEKFGYSQFFYICRVHVTQAELLRADFPAMDTRIEWPEKIIDFAGAMAEKEGGGIITSGNGYALCQPLTNTPGIIEIKHWHAPSDGEALAKEVVKRFGAESYLMRLPSRKPEHAELFGLLCPLNGGVIPDLSPEGTLPYMGLVLD